MECACGVYICGVRICASEPILRLRLVGSKKNPRKTPRPLVYLYSQTTTPTPTSRFSPELDRASRIGRSQGRRRLPSTRAAAASRPANFSPVRPFLFRPPPSTPPLSTSPSVSRDGAASVLRPPPPSHQISSAPLVNFPKLPTPSINPSGERDYVCVREIKATELGGDERWLQGQVMVFCCC